MNLTLLYPNVVAIKGTTFEEGIINYIKLNETMNINRMIITDRNRMMDAHIKYIEKNGGPRLNINMYPFNLPPDPSMGIPLTPSFPINQFNQLKLLGNLIKNRLDIDPDRKVFIDPNNFKLIPQVDEDNRLLLSPIIAPFGPIINPYGFR